MSKLTDVAKELGSLDKLVGDVFYIYNDRGMRYIGGLGVVCLADPWGKALFHLQIEMDGSYSQSTDNSRTTIVHREALFGNPAKEVVDVELKPNARFKFFEDRIVIERTSDGIQVAVVVDDVGVRHYVDYERLGHAMNVESDGGLVKLLRAFPVMVHQPENRGRATVHIPYDVVIGGSSRTWVAIDTIALGDLFDDDSSIVLPSEWSSTK